MGNADVIRVLATSAEPDDVEARVPYSKHIRFDGVWSFGLTIEVSSRCWAGVSKRDGLMLSSSGSASKDPGGCVVIAAMTAWTGLGWRSGNEPLIDEGKLGF